MNSKTNFDNISDGATDQEINLYLKAFLNEKEDMVAEKGVIYALNQLEKIADVEIFNEYEVSYINQVSNFIKKSINYNDYEIMDIILSIVIQMHLELIWYEIIQANDIKNQEVKDLINDAIKENDKYKYFK